MSEDLKHRIDAIEAQFERSLGQLNKVVEFMGNLSAAVGQLTTTWTEERTVFNHALNGHKDGIEQLVKAQTQIASAVDNLSRQCAAMFRLQKERIEALEASAKQPSEARQRPN
jgi:methyl-accepting chemotaxis protein